MFSYSRVECFRNCPYQYKLRYLDKLETLSNQEADNALICGTALHTGIETSVENALKTYSEKFFCLSDKHIEEMIKLEYVIPLAKKHLPPGGEFEVKIESLDFIGFIDYLLPLNEEKTEYAIYDFKYSNNVDRYMEKAQLTVYKYFFEMLNPGKKVKELYFFFVPKVSIRQKKSETFEEFRSRLKAEFTDKNISIKEVKFSQEKLNQFFNDLDDMQNCEKFEKNTSRLCNWCDFQEYCEKGETYMLLPKNERRTLDSVKKRTIWIYGQPFSGKTFFADAFPDPLMLNTDGNIKNVTAPFISIKDTVKVSGRLTERKFAWELFKEIVAELEKKENDFKTIVIDLLEDLYESCRLYKYDELGITHESDNSFKAWDVIRTEFLSTIRRVVNLDYENIILCSHEDTSKDITKRHGDKITAIRPNLNEKSANKIAGMVDLVARVMANDEERVLSFKNDEVVFGGGRFTFAEKEIPLDYETFCRKYDEAKGLTKVHEQEQTNANTSEQEKEEKESEERIETTVVEKQPVRKSRKRDEIPTEDNETDTLKERVQDDVSNVEEVSLSDVVEERPMRRRRRVQ